MRVALGVDNPYTFRLGDNQQTGTGYNTYQAATPWANVSSSNPLVSWQSFNTALQKFNRLTDPISGAPFPVQPDTIVVPQALMGTAATVLNATQVMTVDNQAVSGTVRMSYDNPLRNMPGLPSAFKLLSNRFVYDVTGSDTTWYMGNFKAAFVQYYFGGPGIQSFDRPEPFPESFTRDNERGFKVRGCERENVREPRHVQKITA